MTYTIQHSHRKPAEKSPAYWTSVILTASILAAAIVQWSIAMLFAWEVFL